MKCSVKIVHRVEDASKNQQPVVTVLLAMWRLEKRLLHCEHHIGICNPNTRRMNRFSVDYKYYTLFRGTEFCFIVMFFIA